MGGNILVPRLLPIRLTKARPISSGYKPAYCSIRSGFGLPRTADCHLPDCAFVMARLTVSRATMPTGPTGQVHGVENL